MTIRNALERKLIKQHTFMYAAFAYFLKQGLKQK